MSISSMFPYKGELIADSSKPIATDHILFIGFSVCNSFVVIVN